MFTSVSEDDIASIFRNDVMNAIFSLKVTVSNCKATMGHKPADYILHRQHSENFTSQLN
jgi:hypothetical protein